MLKVIISAVAMDCLLSLLAAKISLDHFGAASLFCVFPILVMINILLYRLVIPYLYRPPENHLGVIYRFGRFHRMVPPDQWILRLPYIDTIHREISLYMRTADLQLKNVELRGGLTVDLRLKVFFKIVIQLVQPENFIQVMRFEGPEWAEMIKTSIEDIIRNQYFLAHTYPEIIDQRMTREIKRQISFEIANRMKAFGIAINDSHGVMVINLQPNNTYLKAVEASKAAASLGEAALERLKPILDTLGKLNPDDARRALLLELASKILEVEELPDLVITPNEDLPRTDGRNSKHIIKDGLEINTLRNKPNGSKYPLAG